MLRKYIIVRGFPVLFSNEITHADVFGKFEGIESAGFFLIVKSGEGQKPKIRCFGESVSLSISSRPEIDQGIISYFLNIE